MPRQPESNVQRPRVGHAVTGQPLGSATSEPAERGATAHVERPVNAVVTRSVVAKDVQVYVEAERRLWEHVGVRPFERFVTLSSGGAVRIRS